MQRAVVCALWRAQPTWAGIIATLPLYPLNHSLYLQQRVEVKM